MRKDDMVSNLPATPWASPPEQVCQALGVSASGLDPDEARQTWKAKNEALATEGAAPDWAADEVHYPSTSLASGNNRWITEIAGRGDHDGDALTLQIGRSGGVLALGG